MKTAIALAYFIYFGFFHPVYVIKRSRGLFCLAMMAAPWAAFWLGWFAR